MPIRARENLTGAWAFLIGIILAVGIGLFSGGNTSPIILVALAIIGVIQGFFVAEKNVQTFLLASVSLVIVSFAGIQGLVSSVSVISVNSVTGVNFGKMAASVLGPLLVLFIPSTIIVALKTVFSLASS